MSNTTIESKIEQLSLACHDLTGALMCLGPEYDAQAEIISEIKEQLRIELKKAWKEYRKA